LFGFKGFSLILPQVLEGVAGIALLYYLVRRHFGAEAALLSSLVLAITPIGVAVDRSNNPDSSLVLVLMLAALGVSVAAERDRLGPLLLAAVLVGVAFNIKMLVAYGVLPAFVLVYLLGTTVPLRRRLFQLVASFTVLAAVSASWGLVVDLTPPEHRPYVGSSYNNSALGLTLGHNGLERIFGLRSESSAFQMADALPGAGRDG